MEEKKISFVEGSVFGSLIRFEVPVLGALVLQAAYGAVDLLVVGRFGDATSISAVGTGSALSDSISGRKNRKQPEKLWGRRSFYLR